MSKVVNNVLSKSSPFDDMGRLHCFDLNLSASQKCRIEDLSSTIIRIDDKNLCTIDSYSETSIIVNEDSDRGEYISITFWFPDFWYGETPWASTKKACHWL